MYNYKEKGITKIPFSCMKKRKDKNMIKTLDEFYRDLGASESSGRYNVVNRYGYAGKYQMGEQAMVAAGYYKPKNKYNNDWTGQFTGQDGIYSLQNFLNNPKAQENAQVAFKRAQWNELINKGATRYLGQNIKGINITASALLAGAHLKGSDTVALFLKSGGKIDLPDKNGVKVSDYMKKFQNYDVAPITNKEYQPPEQKDIFNNIKYQYGGLYHIPSPYETEQEINNKILQNIQNPLGLPTGFATPVGHIYTREDLKNMSKEEFVQNEKAIMKQLKERGIPTRDELEKQKSSSRGRSNSDSDADGGHWVTINGNHVLMKD